MASPRIDLLDPRAFASGQPHDQYRWLREHEPVHWHAEPDGPGFFALTRHSDVVAVGRDSQTFSSVPTIMITDPGPGLELNIDGHQMMLTMDPPRHTRYRRLVSREFLPRASLAQAARIRELAAQIVDAVIERGECDLVDDVAGELPSYVIAELLGLPLDDGRELYRLTEAIHSAPDPAEPLAAANAVMKMFGYASGVIAEKRARPREDLATKLLHAEVDGQKLDDLDFQLFFMLLVDAGGDTTRNLVGGGMLALFEHPDERHKLARDLERLLPSAIEEMLRWVSPVVYMRRTATRDCELAERKVRSGQKVVMYYGAANRDPRAFPEPERFDVTREDNPHVAFGGGGAHFCLGAHLARVEIDAMLREIFARMPDVEPTGPAEWQASTFISGPKHMPVRFAPRSLRNRV
ncbi:MAG TPA: cytochrome P450 [Myxococcota bacterium]|nr:cytochrome P450 [Myxococcota bacterium]